MEIVWLSLPLWISLISAHFNESGQIDFSIRKWNIWTRDSETYLANIKILFVLILSILPFLSFTFLIIFSISLVLVGVIKIHLGLTGGSFIEESGCEINLRSVESILQNMYS